MKLLLHICCGPCSLYVIDELQRTYPELKESNNFLALYANPNIHPYEEFTRRRDNAKLACDYKNVNMDYLLDFDQDKWENFNGNCCQRCEMCYITRLTLAASYAVTHGFTHYTTSLLVSPYQNFDLINKLGVDIGKKYGVEFIEKDFRPGFREGQKQAKELGLYRQKYCGCIRSLIDPEGKD